MKPTPIFLYTPQAGMTPEILERIERNGYMPLAVESFDAVKVMDIFPVASLDPICRAAFDAITNAAYDSARADFGLRVARALGTPKQPKL